MEYELRTYARSLLIMSTLLLFAGFFERSWPVMFLACLFLLLALILYSKQSRVAAVVLLLIAAAGCVTALTGLWSRTGSIDEVESTLVETVGASFMVYFAFRYHRLLRSGGG